MTAIFAFFPPKFTDGVHLASNQKFSLKTLRNSAVHASRCCSKNLSAIFPLQFEQIYWTNIRYYEGVQFLKTSSECHYAKPPLQQKCFWEKVYKLLVKSMPVEVALICFIGLLLAIPNFKRTCRFLVENPCLGLKTFTISSLKLL